MQLLTEYSEYIVLHTHALYAIHYKLYLGLRSTNFVLLCFNIELYTEYIVYEYSTGII